LRASREFPAVVSRVGNRDDSARSASKLEIAAANGHNQNTQIRNAPKKYNMIRRK
jgi:hypothetical protein